MTSARGPENTARFTGLQSNYVRGRPSYPPEVFDAMTAGLPRPLRAVDVGCGTGIATRLLALFADSLLGVEPNEAMLSAARAEGGECRGGAAIRWVNAPAEAMGLEAGSTELVLSAQAFHWFDPPRALAEFHRVLVPGGRAALLWNLRDDRDEGTRQYSAITVPEQERGLDATSIAAREDSGLPLGRSDLFRNYRRQEFHNEQRLDLDGLLARARSASYFPKQDPERGRAESALRELFARAAKDGIFTIHYRVELHLAERSVGRR